MCSLAGNIVSLKRENNPEPTSGLWKSLTLIRIVATNSDSQDMDKWLSTDKILKQVWAVCLQTLGVYELYICIMRREVHRLKQWDFLRSKFSFYAPHPKTWPLYPQSLGIILPIFGIITYMLSIHDCWKETVKNLHPLLECQVLDREPPFTILPFSYFFRNLILSKRYFDTLHCFQRPGILKDTKDIYLSLFPILFALEIFLLRY